MIEIEKNKKKFIEILNIVSNMVIETNITFGKDKVFIKAINPSNTCMSIINILPSFFEIYDIGQEQTYTLDMQMLLKIIKNLSNKRIKIYPENDVLIFKDEKKTFKLNYFVGTKDDRPKPEYKYSSNILLKSSEFFGIIDTCLEFDEIGIFTIENNLFNINSKTHLVKSNFSVDTITIIGTESKVYYDLSYIAQVKNIKNLFETINIYLDNQIPLSIRGSNDDINLEFILANRIGEESE